MVFDNDVPRRVVKTIPGQSICGDDDIFVDDQGTRWVRSEPDDRTGTVSARRAALHNGWILP